MVRLLTAFLLLGLAVALAGQGQEMPFDPRIASGIAVVAFLFMGGSAALVPRVGDAAWFRWAQVVFDGAVFTLLIALSRGPSSSFFALYFLNIMGAVWLLPRWGAIAVAVLDVALYAGVTALGVTGVLPIDVPRGWASLYTDFLLRGFALLLVGLLAAQLAARLRGQIAEQEAQRRLLEAERAAVLTQVPSAVLFTDADGTVRSVNDTGARLLGDVLGRPLGEVLRIAGEQWEQVYERAGERHHILCRKAPSSAGGEVVIVDDITRIKEMEAAAERDERLAAVGRLAAGMAHEIRNPLASMSGAVQLLANTQRSPLHDIVLREVKRLDRLVEDFLDASRPLRLDIEEVDLGALADDVVRSFRADPRYAERVGLQVESDAGVCARVDPLRIRQVLLNLVLNGAQAIPETGEVRLTVRRAGALAEVVVSDDGVGIDAGDLPHIFDPFYTKRTGGTGLGLANVDRVVRAHQGTVEVTSAPSEGTTFVIRVAAVPQDMQPAGTLQAAEAAERVR